MRRSEFDRLVNDELGPTLSPRGFLQTPQRPRDVFDDEPWTVFEMEPEAFARRYPQLAGDLLGQVRCVDIFIKCNRGTKRVRCEPDFGAFHLEGLLSDVGMDDLATAVRSLEGGSAIKDQLSLIRDALGAVLDRFDADPPEHR